MQVELEKTMSKAETIDKDLSVVIDRTGEGILGPDNFSEKNVDELDKGALFFIKIPCLTEVK